MAKGLRIHHPVERDCILIMYRAADPTKDHVLAEIPIHLDENGDSIVCEEIWDSMQEAQRVGLLRNDFIILNDVLDPPTLMVGSDNKQVKNVLKQAEGKVYDPELQAVAQTFAPKGVKARITTSKE